MCKHFLTFGCVLVRFWFRVMVMLLTLGCVHVNVNVSFICAWFLW